MSMETRNHHPKHHNRSPEYTKSLTVISKASEVLEPELPKGFDEDIIVQQPVGSTPALLDSRTTSGQSVLPSGETVVSFVVPVGLEALIGTTQLFVRPYVQAEDEFPDFDNGIRHEILNSSDERIYYTYEDSNFCWMRCCCCFRNRRCFSINVTNEDGDTLITLKRPCTFTCCIGSKLLFDYFGSKVEIRLADGTYLGSAKQKYSCSFPKFSILDENQKEIFKVKGTDSESNFCCCCSTDDCGVTEFFILDKDEVKGRISKNWESFPSRQPHERQKEDDMIGAYFDANLDPKIKAVILACLILIDFMYFSNCTDYVDAYDENVIVQQPVGNTPLLKAYDPSPTTVSLKGTVASAYSVPPGLEQLVATSHIFVKQCVELLEVLSGFETANKYEIVDSMGQRVYFAIEETNCCIVCCLRTSRCFTFKILNHLGQVIMYLKRPCTTTCCLGMCCFRGRCGSTIDVTLANGTLLGSITQKFTCCTPKFSVKNSRNDTVLIIKGPKCGLCPCCACKMCGTVDFNIFDKDGITPQGHINKQWTGVLKETFSDADNYGVAFDVNLDVKLKAVLLGAVILIDMIFFEDSGPGDKATQS